MDDDSNFFGLREAQKIAPLPPPKDFNVANILKLYDINIPEKLPKVDETEMMTNNDIDEIYITLIVNNLKNIFNQMPTFSMPPLFTKETIGDVNENVEKQIRTILEHSSPPPPLKKDDLPPPAAVSN